MAWIESHQELKDHPKTRKLASLLGIHRMQAIGHLHALWWWALSYADDGNLSRFDADDIALGADWEGDPDKFVYSLKNCGQGGRAGFIDDDDWLHDWDMYAGRLVERRNKDRERKREARAARTTDVQRTSDGRDADVGGTAHVPNPTKPNQPSTRDARLAEFDIWWEDYPRKKAKKAAATAYLKARKETSAEVLLAGIAQAKAVWARERRAPEHIPYPATWLNSGQWSDEEEPDGFREPPPVVFQ